MPGQDDNPPPPNGHSLAENPPLVEDPIYLHTRREAKIILVMWVVAMVYTCSYCYLYGYASHPSDPAVAGPTISDWVGPLESFDRKADSVTTPLGLGIPDWVFYGVALPWLACIFVSILFCLFIYEDDDLDSVEEAVSPATEGASNERN
ncbi:MAG: hypothetical protein GXP26_14895 [Planctomycetes bacterium]|nr:hypothetical protein [Planctomycetota bacterium]